MLKTSVRVRPPLSGELRRRKEDGDGESSASAEADSDTFRAERFLRCIAVNTPGRFLAGGGLPTCGARWQLLCGRPIDRSQSKPQAPTGRLSQSLTQASTGIASPGELWGEYLAK